MEREAYLTLLRDLLSGDPRRVREANQTLFTTCVNGNGGGNGQREADLVLAEVPQ